MQTVLSQNSYGKSAVRFAKIIRRPHEHDFKEVAVNIQLEGDFESVYTEGDNRKVLPTDTMKNTVYAHAKTHALDSVEEFGKSLAQYFLQNNPQVSRVQLELAEKLWQRVAVSKADESSTPHPHTFISAGNEKWTSKITRTREQLLVASGIENLLILKTTDSGFENYIKDQYTTLKETNDRILASDVNMQWRYAGADIDFNRSRQTIRQTVLDTFAQHYSYSVQQTIYLLGQAVLEKCPEVLEVHLVMPNKHYIPFDLERFGMENRNEIFVPTDEPFGRIEGTMKRSLR
ncbi:urate oxidase [candidate division KSB1 bacterium]|nr:urate oxidase [candidate division KSB1 bacterium]